jgi:SAM-dependent methyltransferase
VRLAGKSVLNVGGNTREIPLPPQFAGFEHLLLDIDPRGNPDIVCDARCLDTLPGERFDAVYCSHNLEHYYRHEVPRVLAGFLHVLTEGGFAYLRVPDLQQVMKEATERGLDVEDVLYVSPAGPIMVLDVLYGFSVEIERSGKDFFAHKTGFTGKSLVAALNRAGFSSVYWTAGPLEVTAIAFKGQPDPSSRALFGLPPG